MNKDIIIGVVASIGIHLAVINPFSGKQPPPKREIVKKEAVVQFEMPPIEEEKVEEVVELEEAPANQLAPPSLTDTLTVVPVDAFTQPLTPPPPPGMTATSGAISIPVIKPGTTFGKGIGDLFDINNLDQKPAARVQNSPQYPYEMSRAGINGEVLVEFIINANGDVIQTQVVRSSHREFEANALQAVSKWKFKPGRKGGRPVNVKASQLLEFNLDDSK
ncbi:energy transducer TonB [Oleiharenicola lentus]|uniref:energy transducer TonB n=1 Tax=Oleiharenicola lentus TaxID=2508720 RepID=UPI003F670FCB